MGVTRFEGVVSMQSVGTQDVDKLADSFLKLSGSIDSASEKSKKISEHPGFDGYAAKVKAGIQDPLGAASDAMDSVLKAAGPMGAAVSAGIGIFTAVGLAGLAAERSLGLYATGLERTGAVMGTNVEQTQAMILSAERSGGTMEGLTGVVRKLSQEIEGGGGTLKALGINYQDFATGKAKPMLDILLQLGDRWIALGAGSQRDAEAISVLGRSAITALPDVLKLREGMERQTGHIFLKDEIASMELMHVRMSDIDRDWEYLKKTFQEGLVIEVEFVGGAAKWLMGGGSKTNESGDKNAAQNALFGDIDNANRAKGKWGSTPLTGVADLQRKRMQALENLNPAVAWTGTTDAEEAAHLKQAQQYADQIRRFQQYVQPAADAKPTAEQLAAIAANDRRVGSVGLDTDAAKLSAANKKLQELYASLKTGVLPGVNAGVFADISKEESLKKGIEAHIKAAKDLLEIEKLTQAFEKEMGQKEMDPIEKILARRDELLAKGGDAWHLYAAALVGASAVADKADTESAVKFEETSHKLAEINRKNVETMVKDADAAAAKFGLDFAKMSEHVAMIGEQAQMSGMSARAQQTVGFMGMAAGPGQEVVLINAQYRVQMDLAQQVYDIEAARAKKEQDRVAMATAYHTLESAWLQAEIDQENKLGELQRKRLDDLRNLSDQFFDSMLKGRTGIEDFLKNMATGWVRTIFQNIATEELKGQSGHLTLPGQGTAAAPTWLGKALAGTPFGLDPLKDVAATKLTTAGSELSTAAAALIAAAHALAMSGSGGGVGRIPGGVGIYTGSASWGYSPANWGSGGEVIGGGDSTAGLTQLSSGLWVRGPAGDGLDGGYSPANGDWGSSPAAGGAGSFGGGSGGGSGGRKAVGYGAAAIGAALGAYGAVTSPSTKGKLASAGGGLTSIGSALPPPAGPIVMGVGMAMELVSMVMGDPKQIRDQQENARLAESQYTGPAAMSYKMDRYGRNYDTDVSGGLRPIVVQVMAMDSKSIIDHSAAIAEALTVELEAKRSPRTSMALRNTIAGR